VHAELEVVKWIALLSMTLDHYGKIVDLSLFEVTHAIGRLAFPLFAWIIASRLAMSPEVANTYLRWLLPWAFISQPVFVLAGKSWTDWNIMFTLLFGVVTCIGVNEARQDNWKRALPLLVLALIGSTLAEYGLVGVAMIALLTACLQRDRNIALLALAPLSLAANLSLVAPYFAAMDWFAALAVGGAYLPRLQVVTLPRLPKAFFYAYYPAHIYLLHLTDLYLV
jgi:hypothetical protein